MARKSGSGKKWIQKAVEHGRMSFPPCSACGVKTTVFVTHFPRSRSAVDADGWQACVERFLCVNEHETFIECDYEYRRISRPSGKVVQFRVRP